MKLIKIILISAVILSIIIVTLVYETNRSNFKKIKIGEKIFFVEIADTPGERSKGLSGRRNLKENSGMLFIFESVGYHSFWMKDMLMPLDFIWIREKKIVEITENVQPKEYQPPNILTPKNKVGVVLEVNADFIEKNNIKAGERINY